MDHAHRCLLSVDDLADPAHVPAGGWRGAAVEELIEQLTDDERQFPCLFAVKALRSGSLRFVFVDRPWEEDGLEPLARALREFIAVAGTLRPRPSLLALVNDVPGRSVEGYERSFWTVLQRLHESDADPWPADLPRSPEHHLWEYAFAGEPMFVVCSSPAHRRRRSRWAPCLTITFQPRPVFAGLEPDTAAGQRSRRLIRGLLRRYDEVAPSPLLGIYGDADNREWRQYFLDDGERRERGAARCPLSLVRRWMPA